MPPLVYSGIEVRVTPVRTATDHLPCYPPHRRPPESRLAVARDQVPKLSRRSSASSSNNKRLSSSSSPSSPRNAKRSKAAVVLKEEWDQKKEVPAPSESSPNLGVNDGSVDVDPQREADGDAGPMKKKQPLAFPTQDDCETECEAVAIGEGATTARYGNSMEHVSFSVF